MFTEEKALGRHHMLHLLKYIAQLLSTLQIILSGVFQAFFIKISKEIGNVLISIKL